MRLCAGSSEGRRSLCLVGDRQIVGIGEATYSESITLFDMADRAIVPHLKNHPASESDSRRQSYRHLESGDVGSA